MSQANTQALYKQLRSAIMMHHDELIVETLEKILSLDPSDKHAADQLAAIRSNKQTATESNKKKMEKVTRGLYQKFRKACLNKDDQTAWKIINEILDLAPDDAEAKHQKQELGRKIANSKSDEISRIVDTKDEVAISELVVELQQYAPSSLLRELPHFGEAEIIHNAYVRKRNTARLEELFAELNAADGAFEREEKAKSIDSFIEHCALPLSEEKQRTLADIHREWEITCLKSEQYETFNQLISDYNETMEEAKNPSNLTTCIEKLKHIQNGLSELSEVPEINNAIEKIKKGKNRLEASVKGIQIRSRMLRMGMTSLGFILLGTISLFAYGVSSVDERSAALHAAVEHKNISVAQTLLNDAQLMHHIYNLIDSNYKINYQKVENWVADYRNVQKKLKQYEAWVSEHEGKATLVNAPDYLDQWYQCDVLFNRLKSDFNTTIPETTLKKHLQLGSEIFDWLRPSAIDNLTDLGEKNSIEALASKYDEYKTLREHGMFNEEEQQQISQAYEKALKNLVREHVLDPKKLEAVVDELTSSRSRLEVRQEVIDFANTVQAEAQAFNSLPQRLKSCTNLAEYIAALKSCSSLVASTDNAVTIEELQKLHYNLQDLAIQARLNRLTPHAATLSTSEIKQKIDNVQKAYSGESSLFQKFNVSAYNRLINLMTQPEVADEWSSNFHQVKQGNTVYVGKLSKINGEHRIREFTPSMKIAHEALPLGTNCQSTVMDLDNYRKDMGFDRSALQRGAVLPTNLMNSIAKTNSKSYPQLARAYLFSLSIELLKLLNELDSGLAFSPSLRNDIKEFRELQHWLNRNKAALSPKCWCYRHSSEIDRRIESFFSDVAKHDYNSEIIKGISRIKTRAVTLVGFHDHEGRFIQTKHFGNSVLYVLENGKLVTRKSKSGAPFSPVFSIHD